MVLVFGELQALEAEAINVIRTDGSFGRLPLLREQAQATQIAVRSKSPIDVHLRFPMPTRLREDGARAVERVFHVGCSARPNHPDDGISFLSYSVMISQGADDALKIPRKFHFDFEPASQRQAEPKPTFHLQLCGELSAHHIQSGITQEQIAHLWPAWSKPRVPAPPTSLALVLNWLFIE